MMALFGLFYTGEQLSNDGDDRYISSVFLLHDNYPNPFNPVTNLEYDLHKEAFVNVTIFDMLGNKVNKLIDEIQSSGKKSIQWDATNNNGQPVSAGVYLYRIQVGNYHKTKKMILLK